MQPTPATGPPGSPVHGATAGFTLRTAAAVVVLAAALLLGARPALGAYPGQNGKFVYASTSCPCGLVVVDRNGSTRITTSGIFGEPGSQLVRNDDFGVISPDGQWVAFQRSEHTGDFHPAGHPGLYVVRTDGTQLRMLDANASAGSPVTKPTWSGDGSKLAYARDDTANRGDDVRIVDATGPPNPRRVEATAPHPFGVELKVAYVVWSPTDDVLAFTYNRFEGGLVHTRGVGLLDVSADDPSDLAPLVSFSGPLSYPSNFGDYGEPAWSPDGQRIAFTHTELDVRTDTGTTRVETIKRDGTERQPLFPFPEADDSGLAGYSQHPLWSPDGQWIVWKSTSGTTADWQGAHPDGSGRSRIDVAGGSADWGPCFAACASLRPASGNPPDGDGDGVPDASDSCPAVPGPADNDGCPIVTPPADVDGDGVPDASDSCPTVPGPASDHGCPVATPPADGDHDGVPDASDSCPAAVGPASNAGCPVTTGDHTGPTVVIPRSNASIVVTSADRVRFRIGSAGESATGVLVLRTARKVRLGRGRARVTTLGSKAFRTVAGRQTVVTVKLGRRVMALLRRSKSLRVSARITLRDATGNASVKRYDFKIRARRARP